MPLNKKNTIPGLKQIYHKESRRVIAMTMEVSLNYSYVQDLIAFVSTNNLCCSYIKKQKFLLDIVVHHMH